MDDIRNDRTYKGAVIFLGTVLFDGPLELGPGTDIDAAAITAGELAHERGGLEADVSGYSGLVKIAGGATSQVTVTSFGESLLAAADAAAARTLLELEVGTHVQAHSADLAAIAALTGTGYLERNGDGDWELNAGSGGGGGSSDWDDLTDMPDAIDAIDGLTPAADRIIYYTGADTADLATLTSYARTLLDDADAATARATLEAPGLDEENVFGGSLNTFEGALAVGTYAGPGGDDGDFTAGRAAGNRMAWDASISSLMITDGDLALNLRLTSSKVNLGSNSDHNVVLRRNFTDYLELDATGLATAKPIASTLADGTAPITVTSNTVCTGLNADMCDGQHLGTGATPQFAGLTSTSHIVLDNNLGYRVKSSGGTPINVLTIDASNHAAIVAGTGGSIKLAPNGGNQGVQLVLESTTGNLLVGASAAAGSSLASGIVVINGTAPTTFPHAQLYAIGGNLRLANTNGRIVNLAEFGGLREPSAKTASFTGVVGELAPVDLSGASADFVATPPASPNTGDEWGFYVKTNHATHGFGVEILSTANVRGSTSHDNRWSCWLKGERLIFRWDGSTWQPRDGRIAHQCRMRLANNQSGIVNMTVTKLLLDQVDFDNANLGDTTNSRINLKRRSYYLVFANLSWNTLTAAASRVITVIQYNGAIIMNAETSVVAASWPNIHAAFLDSLAGGAPLTLHAYHDSGANQGVLGTASSNACMISCLEVL